MVKKQVFAYLLLGIMLFQLLPFKEVGKLFYGSQMVEEVYQPADSDERTSEGNEDLKKNELYCSKILLNIPFIADTRLAINASDKDYVSRLSDDAPTRPPLASFS